MSGEVERGPDTIELSTLADVQSWLAREGRVLFVHDGRVCTSTAASGVVKLQLAVPSDPSGTYIGGCPAHGLEGEFSSVAIPVALIDEINEALNDEASIVRRLSSWAIVRAFVYLDISDFSTMPTGVQLLVIQSLLLLSSEAESGVGQAEAQLCIGDGYIYVWDSARGATWFAHRLARGIEAAVAARRVPEFHFRMGVHIGEVLCFGDPGRKDWNYIGDGINGGNRVLSAIGKETDDVVFVSGQLRTELLKDTDSVSLGMISRMLNRGRRLDKHKNPWRVYELNHST